MSSVKVLIGTPTVLSLEAFSSWLGRLALSQGATLRELCSFLDLDLAGDIDFAISRAKLRDVMSLCGQPETSFDAALTVFGRLARVIRDGAGFLIRHEGRPRYRYCPLCIQHHQTPYFPLHWRFAAWRWCPEHHCLLEDRCPHCEQPLVGPIDHITAGPDGDGVASMDRCARCARSLAKVEPVHLGTGNGVMTDWQQVLLSNGRALLAALYHGKVFVLDSERTYSLSLLRDLDRYGLLPHRLEWLLPHRLRGKVPFTGQSGIAGSTNVVAARPLATQPGPPRTMLQLLFGDAGAAGIPDTESYRG